MCFVKILSLPLNTMLIVDKRCCDVCCDEFLVPQIVSNINPYSTDPVKALHFASARLPEYHKLKMVG